jgi:hypothetical protein
MDSEYAVLRRWRASFEAGYHAARRSDRGDTFQTAFNFNTAAREKVRAQAFCNEPNRVVFRRVLSWEKRQ